MFKGGKKAKSDRLQKPFVFCPAPCYTEKNIMETKKGGTHMSVLFLEYPKCSTCKKAKAWLEGAGVDFIDRHIVENNPTAEELEQWHACLLYTSELSLWNHQNWHLCPFFRAFLPKI